MKLFKKLLVIIAGVTLLAGQNELSAMVPRAAIAPAVVAPQARNGLREAIRKFGIIIIPYLVYYAFSPTYATPDTDYMKTMRLLKTSVYIISSALCCALWTNAMSPIQLNHAQLSSNVIESALAGLLIGFCNANSILLPKALALVSVSRFLELGEGLVFFYCIFGPKTALAIVAGMIVSGTLAYMTSGAAAGIVAAGFAAVGVAATMPA